MEMIKMNMTQSHSLAKEHNLRGYSRLRKADLINFRKESPCEEPMGPIGTRVKPIDQLMSSKPAGSTWNEPIEQPQKDEILSKALTKHQLKHRRNKASKLSKKSKNLRIEIDDLKSQKDDMEDKIKKASSNVGSRVK